MRKSGLLLIVFSLIFLASCEYRTCPTYTRKPAGFEKMERLNQQQEKAVQPEKIVERV